MDADRFDTLIRSLPTGGSRRRMLVAALAGVAGLLGLVRTDTAGHNALKSCKGKKGDKKKKCLKKAKEHNQQHQTELECQDDGDCDDRTTACETGSCQVVCPQGACPGGCVCVVHLQSNDERPRVCAVQLIQVGPDTCSTDADCTGEEDDVCVRVSTGSCTGDGCGFCVSAINECA